MGKGDAVYEIVDAPELFSRPAKRRLNFLLGRNVALEEQDVFHVFDKLLRPAAKAFVLVDDAQSDARLMERLADGPGNAPLVGHAKNQRLLVR